MTTATKRRKKKSQSPAAQNAADRRVNVAQDVDQAKIAAMTFQNAGNPLTFVADSIAGLERNYRKLQTQEARREFWDSFADSMEKRTPGGWASVYHGLEMLRKTEWYWKPKGYETFNDFLRAEMSHSFAQLDALERRYHFAVTSCPRLFKLSADKADAMIDKLDKAAALKRHGGDRKSDQVAQKRKEQLDFSEAVEVDLESQSEEFKRGYKSYGSTHHFYRFSRLKRESPKVAERLLKGEFTKARKCGTLFVDMAAAEREAERLTKGKFVTKARPSQAKPPLQKAKEAIARLSPAELKQIAKWIKDRK
jgi:hypothetical protein